jgi:hypothetical protein
LGEDRGDRECEERAEDGKRRSGEAVHGRHEPDGVERKEVPRTRECLVELEEDRPPTIVLSIRSRVRSRPSENGRGGRRWKSRDRGQVEVARFG